MLAVSAPVFAVSPQPSWPLWESYNRFMVDPQGRVVDHSAQDHTTSEGQSYAMFFALVANDRVRFDRLLQWTETNLAEGDLAQHLPAWSWGRAPDGQWKVLDRNSASDADLWIAYSLIEAGRLWRNPRYDRLGMALAAQVARQEVADIPGLGATLLPGPAGFHPDPKTWILNPSYLQPSILARLAVVMPGGPWASVLNSLGPILAQGSGAGWAMDWVQAGQGIHPTASPAQHAAGNGEATPVGGYEAIRVYLWLGIADPSTRGLRSFLSDLPAMASYLGTHLAPPEQIDAQGKILNPDSPPGFSASVAPYLRAVGRDAQARAQADRLDVFQNPVSGLYGKNSDYYDQNLALFSKGWLEGRFRFDRNGMLHVSWS